MSDTRNTDRLDIQRGRVDTKSIPSTRDGVPDVKITGGMNRHRKPLREQAHRDRRAAERAVTDAAKRDPHVDTGRLDVHNRRPLGRKIN